MSSAETPMLPARKAMLRQARAGFFILIHQARATASMPESRMTTTILVDISAKLSAGVVSMMLVIIPRSIITPKVKIKYCAAALTRMNRVISRRSSQKNEARVIRILMTLKATTGIERKTSALCSESTGSSAKACL